MSKGRGLAKLILFIHTMKCCIARLVTEYLKMRGNIRFGMLSENIVPYLVHIYSTKYDHIYLRKCFIMYLQIEKYQTNKSDNIQRDPA